VAESLGSAMGDVEQLHVYLVVKELGVCLDGLVVWGQGQVRYLED